MLPDSNILYHAVPALAILIIAEAVYMIKEHRHDNKDLIASMVLALGALPLSLLIKGFVIYTYTLIYQFRLFTIPGYQWWAWVICFFADDLSYYWYHRLSHEVRFFWASHMVHHSSEQFTFSAGLRVPWTSNLTGTFLFWAWMPLIGIEPYMVIFMKSASVIYQFWMHTETINKLPKWFEAVFNTPSHHRVHHSSNIEYLDKNHAGTLIIWDKLFGTYQDEITKPKYGLTENIRSTNPFTIEFYEWKNLIRDLKKTKAVKHRIQYLFNSPGWSHDGSTKTTRQLQSELNLLKADPVYNSTSANLKCTLLTLTGIIMALCSSAQEKKLKYYVIKNGNIIGNINFVEFTKDQKKFISLTSAVESKFIFSFSHHSSETAAYDNGVMIYSSFYQKQNGSKKVDKKTIASGECYKLMESGELKSITCNPIRYNMLRLFNCVPENINKVYSDNYQKLLDIQKVKENKYRLTLPDGNYNYYSYKDGVCSRVDVERAFFKVQFILKNE